MVLRECGWEENRSVGGGGPREDTGGGLCAGTRADVFEERQIDGAAARLGLSRRRFTTLFREVAGDTWFNAVRALRLAHARRLSARDGAVGDLDLL